MAEVSRKEDAKNGILDRINAWAVSNNPFAKFVRFVAATLYSGGVIVGGLVTGVTNTLLGREIAGKEREYDLRKSAERDLKEKIKVKETPSDKESKQTDERKEKSCEEMNHDSFLNNILVRIPLPQRSREGLVPFVFLLIIFRYAAVFVSVSLLQHVNCRLF